MASARRLHDLFPFRGRTSTVALVLFTYLVALVGFPLPRFALKDASTQPFPCQHRACGCLSADHCQQCCCCCSSGQALPRTARLDESAREEARVFPEHPCPDCPETEQASPHPASAPAVVWVIGMQARQCGGLVTDWADLGVALAPSPPTLWAYDWTPAGWVRPTDSLCLSCFHLIPDPPPRS